MFSGERAKTQKWEHADASLVFLKQSNEIFDGQKNNLRSKESVDIGNWLNILK